MVIESEFIRNPDDDILMALPELYRYGREGHWFTMKLFLAYMLDGIMQVCSEVLLLTSTMVITFTVGDNFLYHPVRLLCAHLPIGWLRRRLIRVFHCHGYFRRLRGQSVQRLGNKRLDWLGVLCCGPRQCSHLKLYREYSFGNIL